MTDVLDKPARAKIKLAPDELPPAWLWLGRRRSRPANPDPAMPSPADRAAELRSLQSLADLLRGKRKP